MSTDTSFAKTGPGVIREVERNGDVCWNAHEPHGFSWELGYTPRLASGSGRGSIMRFKIDLESRQLPSLELLSKIHGDAVSARHLEEHAKAWETGSLLMKDYLTKMGLPIIGQRVSELQIPVLDSALLSDGLEAGANSRSVQTLERKWDRQGFEQLWEFEDDLWKCKYWARTVDTPGTIRMRVSGGAQQEGSWIIEFDSHNAPILGSEVIDATAFRARPSFGSATPQTYVLTQRSWTLPYRSFCVSQEDFRTYEETIDQAAPDPEADNEDTNGMGPLMMTVTPLQTSLTLSDPSWEARVTNSRGMINPGPPPPADFSVFINNNQQMGACFEQLQPFYVKLWDPTPVGQAESL